MDGENILAGVEEQVVAEPTTEEVTENPTVEETAEAPTNVEETAEPTNVKTEEDSRFASVRRKAEEDARAKYEAETNTINNEFKRVFGGYTNPVTGKPIESWKDYIEAIEAQNRKAQEDSFKEKGIDPKALDEYIQNSPAMRQAQEILAQNQKAEAERQLNEDIKALSALDSDIKNVDDLIKHPSYEKVLQMVQNNGYSLVDAYKIANFDSLVNKQSAAAKQAAINQAKSKDHLEKTSGISDTGKDLVEIPASVLASWRQVYPDLTPQQLKEKYNAVL